MGDLALASCLDDVKIVERGRGKVLLNNGGW